MSIQPLQHTIKNLRIGFIVPHADLLADDPLLFIHALLGVIRNRNKRQQDSQIFLKLLHPFKIVAGDGGGGKRIG